MYGGNSSRACAASGGPFAREPGPVDNRLGRADPVAMALSEQVQRVLAAARGLSIAEREELIAELILSVEGDREPDPGYDEAWSAELHRRIDAVVGGASTGKPWSSVRSDIAAKLAERRRHRV